MQALWFFLTQNHELYTRHAIPKKTGGARILHVPDVRLAAVQQRVLETFLNRLTYPAHVSAYVCGRNVYDAASTHAGRPILIVLDIKDFFPSTKRAWVRAALQRELSVTQQTAYALGTLVCAPWRPGVQHHYVVPQGAPTSGAVANIVAMQRLDPAVLDVCARWDMAYTRYADDLAFSRTKTMSRDDASAFVAEIVNAVRGSGYKVNYTKIRVLRPHNQQRLLGLTLNEHPNLPRNEYRRIRALVHSCTTAGYAGAAARHGYESAERLFSYLNGYLAYALPLSPARVGRLVEALAGVSAPGCTY